MHFPDYFERLAGTRRSGFRSLSSLKELWSLKARNPPPPTTPIKDDIALPVVLTRNLGWIACFVFSRWLGAFLLRPEARSDWSAQFKTLKADLRCLCTNGNFYLDGVCVQKRGAFVLIPCLSSSAEHWQDFWFRFFFLTSQVRKSFHMFIAFSQKCWWGSIGFGVYKMHKLTRFKNATTRDLTPKCLQKHVRLYSRLHIYTFMLGSSYFVFTTKRFDPSNITWWLRKYAAKNYFTIQYKENWSLEEKKKSPKSFGIHLGFFFFLI